MTNMIGEKTIAKVQEILGTLIYEYSGAINDTFSANKGGLTITMSMKLIEDSGSVICTGTIGFPMGKVSDKITEKVSEEHGNLFEKEE